MGIDSDSQSYLSYLIGAAHQLLGENVFHFVAGDGDTCYWLEAMSFKFRKVNWCKANIN